MIKAFFLALLMTLPRVALSYAAYTLTPLLISLQLKTLYIALALSFASLVAILFSSMVFEVSAVAAILQTALSLPVFLALLGAKSSSRIADPMAVLRLMNVIVLVGGLFGLFSMGFPFRLPYIDYRPDYFWGFFGMGGAKIVTIIGFFGVFVEIWRRRSAASTHVDNIFLIIAILNFIVPNYILGMLCGFAALSIILVRRATLLIPMIAVALMITPYVLNRAQTIDSSFSEVYGAHPKAYQFKIAAEALSEYPHAVLFGVGPGQFGGQAAIWASPAGDIISSHARPNIPGLFAARPHMDHLAPPLLRFRDNFWAISSSANKPTSSFTVIIVEHGVLFLIIVSAFSVTIYARKRLSLFGLSIIIFIFLLFSLDVWHDSPWLGMCLLLVNNILGTESHSHRSNKKAAKNYEATPSSAIS